MNFITECRRIYLCHNEDSNALMYFTSELSQQGTYFLYAWTKQHCHLLLDMEPGSSEFDQVAKLFKEFADFKPEMIKAV